MHLYSCSHCNLRLLDHAYTRMGRCPRCRRRLAPVWMPELPRAEPGSFPEAPGVHGSLVGFLASDPRRMRSREVDYGLSWRDGPGGATHRAAWIEQTGELYVVQSGLAADGGGHVAVLGAGSRAAVEGALEGWERRVGRAGSLGWLRARCDDLGRSARDGGGRAGRAQNTGVSV